MKYQRFYDNTKLFKSKEVSFSDLVLAIFIIILFSFAAFPIIVISFLFTMLMILFVVIDLLFNRRK
jgi:hypothetical protein